VQAFIAIRGASVAAEPAELKEANRTDFNRRLSDRRLTESIGYLAAIIREDEAFVMPREAFIFGMALNLQSHPDLYRNW
jgi:hypothetical protein